MSKAILYVASTTDQVVPVNGIISLGGVIRRYGCGDCGKPIIDLTGNAISLNGSGYYDVDASVVVTPTAAGTVTVTLYQDGVPVPGATASATVAAVDATVTVPIDAVVRVFNCNTSALTVVLTGAASTVNNIAVEVNRL